MKRIGKLMAVLLLCVCCIPQQVFAYVRLDLTKKASIALEYECPDTEFRLYRVADVSETVEFTLTGDFEKYQDLVKLENLKSEDWRKAAKTLADFAVRDKLTCLESKKTDKNGRLTFSEDKTPVGLYLILGEKSSHEAVEYTPMPALVSLPELTKEDTWDYEITVIPKYETKNPPSEGEPSQPGEPPKPPTKPQGPKLPQTGQLWWPVPVLFLTGGVCCLEGIRRRKKGL